MSQTYEVEIVDEVAYSEKDGNPLRATIYRPRGKGPFPALVSIRGGGWRQGNRMSTKALDEALAQRGIVVMAPDFRDSNVARYPEALRDVNLAIRWLKGKSAEYGATAKVGAIGCSSGGQQVLTTALRPRDAAFRDERSAAAGTTNAALSYVVACFPVTDPVALQDQFQAQKPGETTICDHFFGTREAMAVGSPLASLEQGRFEATPPALIVHGTADEIITEPYLRKFEAAYRKAGGQIGFELYQGQPHSFVVRGQGPEVTRAYDDIARFVHAQPIG